MGDKGKKIPKCLLKIPGSDQTLLERQIKIFEELGVKNITIITGHLSGKIKKKIKSNVKFLNFPNYKKTNNLQTLLYCKQELNKSLICIFSDLIFDKKIIVNLLKKKGEIVTAIDTGKVLEGTMRIKIKKKKLIDIGPQIKTENADGNFIGICKFNENGVIKLKKYLEKNSKNRKDYYTLAIKQIIKKSTVNFFDCKKYFWMEIDDKKDYKKLKLNIKI